MKPSRLLRTKVVLASRRLDGVTSSLWLHPDLGPRMAEVLFVLYDVARASVPLMEAALGVARARAGDPVAAGLAGYLERHISEEQGHDLWLLEDLEVLGVDRTSAAGRFARPSVAAMIGAQHYWLLHAHPVAVLGYIAVIEGNPPPVEGLEGIIAGTGLPRAAFRTWLHHARLDPGHKAELDALLDALPLSVAQTGLLSVSALHTIASLCTIFEELLQQTREAA